MATSRTAASSSPARARLPLRQVKQQAPVAVEGNETLRLPDDVFAAAATHFGEVELTVVSGADRRGEELGTARLDHDATAFAFDHTGGLALSVGSDDHRPPRRQDAVEAAWHDVAGQAGSEADDVYVGTRKRQGEGLAWLIAEEADAVGFDPLDQLDQLGVSRATPDHHHREVIEVA